MKRIILILLIAVTTVSGYAQKLHSYETIRKTELGNQRLLVSDSVFFFHLKTGSRAYPKITVVLGGRDDALRILRFLAEVKPKSGDVIELENENNDIVGYNSLGQYVFYSSGRQFSAQMSRRYVKGYIEAIENYGKEGEKADEEQEADDEDERDVD